MSATKHGLNETLNTHPPVVSDPSRPTRRSDIRELRPAANDHALPVPLKGGPPDRRTVAFAVALTFDEAVEVYCDRHAALPSTPRAANDTVPDLRDSEGAERADAPGTDCDVHRDPTPAFDAWDADTDDGDDFDTIDPRRLLAVRCLDILWELLEDDLVARDVLRLMEMLDTEDARPIASVIGVSVQTVDDARGRIKLHAERVYRLAACL